MENNVDLSKVKCVITDFDRTLYSFPATDNSEYYYVSFLISKGYLAKNRKTFGGLKEKFPKWHNLQRAMYFLKSIGKSPKEMLDYMDKNPYNFITEKTVFITPNHIENLAKKYPVYLISDSSQGYIKHYLKIANIKKGWFVNCYSNNYESDEMTKTPYMKKIIDETGFAPNEILMVGDSYQNDIIPAKQLGMQTYLVNTVDETEYIFNKLASLKK